jgi:hypothetical protein
MSVRQKHHNTNAVSPSRNRSGRRLSETVRLAARRTNDRRKSGTTSIMSSLMENYFDVNKKKEIKKKEISVESIQDMICENFGNDAIKSVPRSFLQTLVDRIASHDRTSSPPPSTVVKKPTSVPSLKQQQQKTRSMKSASSKVSPMRGLLWKRGGRGLFGGGMKQRYFVLDRKSKEIRYYRRNPDIEKMTSDTTRKKNFLGTVRLQEAVAITSDSDGVSFDIHTGKRIWYLKALSQNAAFEWISAITDMIPHIMTNIAKPNLDTSNVSGIENENGIDDATNLNFRTMTSKIAFSSSDDWYVFLSLSLLFTTKVTTTILTHTQRSKYCKTTHTRQEA